MHIENQLCGMAILVILLYLFLQQKRIGLYSELVFLRTLVITMVSLCLDIASLIAIAYRDGISDLFLDAVCKSYLVSLIWVAASAYMYVVLDQHTQQTYNQHIKRVVQVGSVESVIVFCLPIQYHVDSRYVYTKGPSVLMTYVFGVSFIVMTIYVIVRFGGKIEKKRRIATFVWMAMWMVGCMVQFFNNELLLAGFLSSLGILILYCVLENPENHIDHKFGCFRTHALLSYLDQCYGRGESKSILFLSFISRQRKNYDTKHIDECMRRLINWLGENTSARIFNNVENELAIVFSNMTEMSSVFNEIQEMFYVNQFYHCGENGNLVLGENPNSDAIGAQEFPETLFVLFPDTMVVNSTDEIMAIHQSLYAENHNLTKSFVCYVNHAILEKMRQKDHMVDEIIHALDEDRVEVFFQPIYSVSRKQFVSAEALVRIRKNDGSILSPGAFIPVAEESGLIGALGERVFEKVCAFLKEQDPKQLGIDYVEVNLSVVQCGQQTLAKRYLNIMQQYGTNPWYINLEITETGTVDSEKILLKNMNDLIRHGVSFSLDDFGNGQSNLDYMIHFPVSVMKLDMNMTQAYFTDMKAKVVVQSAIKLAHELDLFVVAEGVETKEQLEEMTALHVDYIQGYYFSKPLPVNEYVAFVQARNMKSGRE